MKYDDRTEHSIRRVKVGQKYIFNPCNVLDMTYQHFAGEEVRVCYVPGMPKKLLPPPWCHVRVVRTGDVLMINRGSLERPPKTWRRIKTIEMRDERL